MLTVFFYCTGKPGRGDELRSLLLEMTEVTRREDAGCVNYTFHREREKPDQWILYEQWRDQASVQAHIANMYAHFGPPPDGARLPARMHELVESFRIVPCEVVA